ncbi:MAG: hypothetical protein V4471_04185 [Pseudomonadota bacterium]
MNEQAFIKIKKDILEIIDSLKMPFKLEIEEQLKTQITLSKYFPDIEENIQALNLCLCKAKSYKKIELDFPDTLITSDEELSLKLELVRKNLAKRYALFLGEFFSVKANELEALIVYEDVKIFLHKIINRFALAREINVKILNFLAIFFEKNEIIFSICSFKKALKDFFGFIEYLVDEKCGLQTIACVEKLNILENLEFFSNKIPAEINKSAYKIIYEMDVLLLYKSLLLQIRLLTKSIFSGDLILKEFIAAFIDQFSDLSCLNKDDFDSIILLLYLVLEDKARKPIVGTSSIWINTLGSEIKEKLIGETEIGLQLLEFRKSYEQKTPDKFAAKVKQFKDIDPVKVNLFLKIEEIAPEVICRLFLENINRSTVSVKQAFFLTLKKMDYISLRPIEHYDETIAEMKNPLEKGIGFYKKKFIDAAKGIATKSLELIKNFESNVPSEKIELAPSNEVSKNEGIVSAAHMKENLNKINEELQIFKSNLKSLCFGINIIYPPVHTNFEKEKDLKYPLAINILAEIEKLKKEVGEFLKKNSLNKFSEKLINNILFLNKRISWFDSEAKPLHFVKQLFRRGYFSKDKIRFAKLKNRLDTKIDFDAEISFFKNQSFFSLLSYGVIRWPWLNKTFFAADWAEQLVFLKAIDQINEKKYDIKLAQYIANSSLDNECNCLSEVIELYNHITSARVEKQYSLVSIYSSLNSDIKSFESKVETLLGELSTRALPIQKRNQTHRAQELFFDKKQEKYEAPLSLSAVNLTKN